VREHPAEHARIAMSRERIQRSFGGVAAGSAVLGIDTDFISHDEFLCFVCGASSNMIGAGLHPTERQKNSYTLLAVGRLFAIDRLR
jgi:hypothetical protein